jgi:hypothetical protein
VWGLTVAIGMSDGVLPARRPASKDTLSQADCAPVGIPCTLPGQLPGAIAALSMFFVQVEAKHLPFQECAPLLPVPAAAPWIRL